MSGTERQRYQKSVDDIVLDATGKELERLQRIDLEVQKQGGTFYESFAVSERTSEHLSSVKKTRQI